MLISPSGIPKPIQAGIVNGVKNTTGTSLPPPGGFFVRAIRCVVGFRENNYRIGNFMLDL
jgi:hypothetical protein